MTKLTLQFVKISLIISAFLINFTAQNILADTHYVSPSGGNVSPYTSWETAATDIQAAVDAASTGDSVLITNGTYFPGSQVSITKSITVESVNGADDTIINGSHVHRCVYMTAGVLDGFTVSNGYANGSSEEDKCGGGVYCDGGGTVQNCIISGNSIPDEILTIGGGGVFLNGGGTVQYCTISGNSALVMGHAGGVECYGGGTVHHCIISENSANMGGGVKCSGGGTVRNSTINGNSAPYGAGVYCGSGGIVQNCTISKNSSSYSGGGVLCVGVVRNCSIIGNSAAVVGGGVKCFGGGAVYNSIIFNNSASNYFGDGLSYCCSTPLPSGVGNISNNPEFVSITDFHLTPISPCIDVGNNTYVTGTYDLDGNPRIWNGIVDMGAYEFNGVIGGFPIQASDGLRGFIKIDWNIPATATKYKVYHNSIDNTNSATIVSGEINVNSYSDYDIIFDQIYYYWVKAGNSNGWSDFSLSNSGWADTPCTYSNNLFYPLETKVTAVGNESYPLDPDIWYNAADINLDWSSYLTNHPDVAGVYYSVDQSFTTTVTYSDTYVDKSVASNAVISLSGPGIWYAHLAPLLSSTAKIDTNALTHVRIKHNASGPPVASGTHPDTNIWYANQNVNLSWSPAHGDTGSVVSSYYEWDALPNTVPDTNSSSVIDYTKAFIFQPEGTWYFHVRTLDHAGFLSETTHFRVNIGLPSPPTGVIATDGTYNDKVNITWLNVIGAVNYNIYRSESNNVTLATLLNTSLSNIYSDTTITPGKKYYYWIAAIAGVGNSDLSESDSGYAKLSQPAALSATDGTYNDKVNITWSDVIGAVNYNIYRSESNNSALATLLNTSLSNIYSDTTITPGKKYYYWIAAIASVGNSDLSESDSGFAKLSQPAALSATDGTYNDKVNITWSDVIGAVNYNIYRNESNNSALATLLNTSLSNIYSDTTITPGKKYYYWIAAIASVGNSDLSESDSGFAKLSKPAALSATDGTYNNKVNITWSNVIGAVNYNIYRNESNNSALATLLNTSLSNIYSDTTITPGKKYYYWIAAIASVGNSDLSESDSGYAKLSQPAALSATDGTYNDKVNITWSDVIGAVNYNIYRSESNNSALATLLNTSLSNIYSDTTITPGKKYYYWIAAIASVGNSDLSESDSGFAKLSQPAALSATDGTYNDKVNITWSDVIGAVNYNIYRNESNNSALATLLNTSLSNIYSDTTITPGKKYYYWIAAIASVGNSDLSESDSGFAKLSKPAALSATDGTYNNKVNITWSNVIGAVNYNIYRNESNNSALATLLNTSLSNIYSDTTITPGKKYYYWIAAIASVGNSDLSESDSGFAKLSKPAALSATDGTYNNKVNITWSNVIGAVNYNIYRSESNNSALATLLNTSLSNIYSDITVTPGQKYYYWVSAIADIGNSDLSDSDSGYAKLTQSAGIFATDGDYNDKVDVTWSNVPYALAYNIYRGETNDATIATLLGISSNNSYSDATVIPGVKYFYWIGATADVGDSDLSDSDSGFAKLTSPVNISATDGNYYDKVDVTWSNVPHALAYNIYRGKTNYAAVATLTGTSTNNIYSDATVIPGVKYFYWIGATADVGDSDLSDSDSGFAKLTSPVNISATDGDYYDKVDVTWSNVPHAIAYNIYRGETNDVDIATLLGTLSSNIYSDPTVIPGVKYYYWIKATADVGESDTSNSDSGYAQLITPTSISATDGDYNDKVVITWLNVIGATEYCIFRSQDSGTNGLIKIGNTVNKTYEDITVIPGTKYYYRVQGIADVGNSELSDSDIGYALFTSTSGEEWKYKHGKKVDVLKGKMLIPNLVTNLLAGWQIGLASVLEDGTITNFNGPFSLENKKNKNKLWFLKKKKEVIIKYKYNAKKMKDSLLYKLWNQMPESKILYLIPESLATNMSNQMINSDSKILGIELIEKKHKNIKGWQKLSPVIIRNEMK